MPDCPYGVAPVSVEFVIVLSVFYKNQLRVVRFSYIYGEPLIPVDSQADKLAPDSANSSRNPQLIIPIHPHPNRSQVRRGRAYIPPLNSCTSAGDYCTGLG